MSVDAKTTPSDESAYWPTKQWLMPMIEHLNIVSFILFTLAEQMAIVRRCKRLHTFYYIEQQ